MIISITSLPGQELIPFLIRPGQLRLDQWQAARLEQNNIPFSLDDNFVPAYHGATFIPLTGHPLINWPVGASSVTGDPYFNWKRDEISRLESGAWLGANFSGGWHLLGQVPLDEPDSTQWYLFQRRGALTIGVHGSSLKSVPEYIVALNAGSVFELQGAGRQTWSGLWRWHLWPYLAFGGQIAHNAKFKPQATIQWPKLGAIELNFSRVAVDSSSIMLGNYYLFLAQIWLNYQSKLGTFFLAGNWSREDHVLIRFGHVGPKHDLWLRMINQPESSVEIFLEGCLVVYRKLTVQLSYPIKSLSGSTIFGLSYAYSLRSFFP